MESKKWYLSKRVWSVASLVASALLTYFSDPAIAIIGEPAALATIKLLTTVGSGLGVSALLSPQTPIGK